MIFAGIGLGALIFVITLVASVTLRFNDETNLDYLDDGILVKHVVALPWLLGYLSARSLVRIIEEDHTRSIWNLVVWPRRKKDKK